MSIKGLLKAVIIYVGELYARCYGVVCGRFPNERPWHFQWHATRELHNDLKVVLPALTGQVLDLGCGIGPYRAMLTGADKIIGVDVEDGAGVDILIVPGEPLPFKDNSFDCVMSTQVFEHVEDLDSLLREIKRVLKPSGKLVASVPFMYQVHGAPYDFRRFSEYGVTHLLEEYEVDRIYRQGRIGSSCAVLVLGWVHMQLMQSTIGALLRWPLLPVWIFFCLLVNCFALVLDAVDTTRAFYHNLLVVTRSK